MQSVETKPLVCRRCQGSILVREARHGLWEKKVFPVFNLYPWECVICRLRQVKRRRVPESSRKAVSR